MLAITAVVMTATVRSELLALVTLLVLGSTNIMSGIALSGSGLASMRSQSQIGATALR